MASQNKNVISTSNPEGIISFVITIFSGAFLLFLIQPLIGKYILPWFGGGVSVWTTCLLFFQLVLLAGYTYAHFVSKLLSQRMQTILHIALLLSTLIFLPITPADSWKPHPGDNPTLGIFMLLLGTVGLPYFVLSTTGPLMQKWFSILNAKTSPYRLYALSNLGSLLALVGFPFLFEPNFTRKTIALVWSGGMVVFILACSYSAYLLFKRHPSISNEEAAESLPKKVTPPSAQNRILWFALSAAATVMLLATSNKLCLELTVVPFLWVLPLGLYLLSFIICFDKPEWYSRLLFGAGFIISLAWFCYLQFATVISFHIQIYTYSGVLFFCCMLCNGELVRLKPPSHFLTSYYLSISAGGALGGLLVALVAPNIFNGYYEYNYGLGLSCVLLLSIFFYDKKGKLYQGKPRLVWAFLLLGLGTVGYSMYKDLKYTGEKQVDAVRNFYGALSVDEQHSGTPLQKYLLQNGQTMHGVQYTDSTLSLYPTSYYGENSGIGLAIRYFPHHDSERVGIIGLGIGTIAAYGHPNDYFRFYEINPADIHLANTRFSYLKHCPSRVDIIEGDARLSMENEPSQQFDVLALDAFTSEAIPLHLLTKEAFATYLRHIKPNGVIAVHISNSFLNLLPPLQTIGNYYKLSVMQIHDEPDENKSSLSESTWIILTTNNEFLNTPEIIAAANAFVAEYRTMELWTDDYSSLFPILD